MKSERVTDFHKIDLNRGVRLFIHPTKKFKTVTIKGFFHVPLGPDATRVALLPQVLRRGCRRTPTLRAMTMFLEDLYGASFGADVFKLGEMQVVGFSLEVVNDRYTPHNIGAVRKAVEFLGRVVTQPVLERGGLRKEYVAQERENLKRLIEGLINDRAAYAYERCIGVMCRDEPFHIREYGRVEELAGIDARQLCVTHTQLLKTAPADLFVVGDVQTDHIARMVSRAFRLRRNGTVAILPPADRPAPPTPREVIEKLDVEQGNLVIGARTGIRWASSDVFALSMANGILGAFPHSKLFVNVRERDNLAYSVHSWIDLTKGLLFITAGIDVGKYAEAVRTIREQLAALQAGEVSDEEMSKTRATLLDRIWSRDDSPAAKVSAFHEMLWHGRVEPSERLVERYQAVTREEVVAAARKIYLDTIYFLTKG